jgi:hypothetical protein
VATHEKKPWLPAGRNPGRLRGEFHGHRQYVALAARTTGSMVQADPKVTR